MNNIKKKPRNEVGESSRQTNKHSVLEEHAKREEEIGILNQMSGFTSLLPLIIVYDIFSRIPVKSLSQCRWVCKSWYKIINNPRFAQIQLAKASQIFSPCVTYFNRDQKQLYLVDHQVFDNHEISTTVHNTRLTDFDKINESVGLCNGLICLSPFFVCSARLDFSLQIYPFPYYIYNPITSECLAVYPRVSKFVFNPQVFGFGYSQNTNEYKIVHIMNTREVEVYTLGSSSWRRIADIPHMVYGKSVFVNGALHWSVYRDVKVGKSSSIAALDIETEQFREIPPPPCSRPSNKTLGVIEGCLCVIDSNFDSHREIWVMKSYGVQESWSKEYVFDKVACGSKSFWNGAYEVVKLKNGEWLFQNEGESNVRCYEMDLLHYYNPNNKVYERIVTRGGIHPDAMSLLPIVHVGSLISPNYIGRSNTIIQHQV